MYAGWNPRGFFHTPGRSPPEEALPWRPAFPRHRPPLERGFPWRSNININIYNCKKKHLFSLHNYILQTQNTLMYRINRIPTVFRAVGRFNCKGHPSAQQRPLRGRPVKGCRSEGCFPPVSAIQGSCNNVD